MLNMKDVSCIIITVYLYNQLTSSDLLTDRTATIHRDWMDVGFGDAGAMPATLKGWKAVGSSIVQSV